MHPFNKFGSPERGRKKPRKVPIPKDLVIKVGSARYELDPVEIISEPAADLAAALDTEPPGPVILTSRSARGWGTQSAIGLCWLWAALKHRRRVVIVRLGSKPCADPLSVLFAVWATTEHEAEQRQHEAAVFIAWVIDPADHPGAAATVVTELASPDVSAEGVLSGVADCLKRFSPGAAKQPVPLLRLRNAEEAKRTPSTPLFEGEWWLP